LATDFFNTVVNQTLIYRARQQFYAPLRFSSSVMLRQHPE